MSTWEVAWNIQIYLKEEGLWGPWIFYEAWFSRPKTTQRNNLIHLRLRGANVRSMESESKRGGCILVEVERSFYIQHDSMDRNKVPQRLQANFKKGKSSFNLENCAHADKDNFAYNISSWHNGKPEENSLV